ncbi:MAG: hypothetical protein HY362_04935 [Candidatus Aenigmarchaeota archaeon]|nr:hypothetical protein [Candidatus Aenigmarchaeota archaeon]
MKIASLGVLLISVVFIAGCTGQSSGIDSAVKGLPAVQSFLSQYTNARITTNLLDNQTVFTSIASIRKDCNNQVFPISSYYKTVVDDGSGTFLTVWTDEKTQKTVCVVLEKNGVKTHVNADSPIISTPSTTTTNALEQPTTSTNIAVPTTTTIKPTTTTVSATTTTNVVVTTTTTVATTTTTAVPTTTSTPTTTASSTTSSSTTTTTANRPDFTISYNNNVVENTESGKKVTIVFTVTNSGNAYSGAVRVDAFITQFSGCSKVLQFFGSSVQSNCSNTGIAAGTYNIRLVADLYNSISESNENNNEDNTGQVTVA